MTRSILVTGGLGFIGSAFVRRRAGAGDAVVNVDVGTYAADARRLTGVQYDLLSIDVVSEALDRTIAELAPDVIVHFAAESHVTRGELEPEAFFRSNVDGTRNVMSAAASAGTPLVVHVSTDEVYGPCFGDPFKEADKLPGEGNATSAYARSKALADDVARSFSDRVALIVIRPTNCYGPWQNPEKAIPRWATRALRGRRLPVWGDGKQIRDWMFVEDAITGIDTIIERGRPGETYNLGPDAEQRTNLEIAILIARAAGLDDDAVYLTEYDRPDHDRRYAIDAGKARALGWEPEVGLDGGIARTIAWYRANEEWWEPLVPGAEGLYRDAHERAETR